MPKVLIADDSLSVRKVAERLMLAAGFDVELAANGEEALAGLTASQPDMLFSLIVIPHSRGKVCFWKTFSSVLNLEAKAWGIHCSRGWHRLPLKRVVLE